MDYKQAFEELLKTINSIKDFCEYESNIYTDTINKTPNSLKMVHFEGKKEAFNNVLDHIKNLESNSRS